MNSRRSFFRKLIGAGAVAAGVVVAAKTAKPEPEKLKTMPEPPVVPIVVPFVYTYATPYPPYTITTTSNTDFSVTMSGCRNIVTGPYYYAS